MLLFLWAYTTIIFAIAYLFQVLNLTLIGLEVVTILILFISFWESTKGRYWRIIGMNIINIIFISILYFSQHTFTYIQHHDVEKMLVIVVSFVLSQLLGIFWGRQFYKHQEKSKK
ncbi:hypothetical protein P7H90_06870 [Lactococcus lactis]|jgi:hypothetical protein|uniref:Uncharacterized protein n=1 Tax=Lactococcus lactis TaxID=1358 RepID=A0AAW8UGI7_9LACT|nr:hypothetical protein [Lactococcus lactis]MDT2871103.1 hypothetical protein [Lactococcus lactis]MDT2873523.1 hypothetical protein [Lactococcus lactis]MDT2876368.1 hypothetical protein [Lactococcus lactis]MDT2881166.1 hypothetical protein [Lactococcus lactis]MDT2887122.1 hypothetical protein [Lactococcus lactis]